MNSQSKMNAKAALNNLKMEIAADFGDASYFDVDKSKNNMQNAFNNETVDEMKSENLLKMGEQALLNKYNTQK